METTFPSLGKQVLSNDEYIRSDTAVCPFCNFDDIEFVNYDFDHNTAHYELECDNCGAVWRNNYALVGFEVLLKPNID